MPKRGGRRHGSRFQPPHQHHPSQQQFHHSNYIPPRHTEPTVTVRQERRRSLESDIAECGSPAELEALVFPAATRCATCGITAGYGTLAPCHCCKQTVCVLHSKLCDDCYEDICVRCDTKHRSACRGYPEKYHQAPGVDYQDIII